MLVIAPILFNGTPIYEDYKLGFFSNTRAENVSLDFAIFYEYPGIRQEDYFYLAVASNIYLSYYCGVLICTFDLFLVLMVFQIIGHIKTLMIDFESIQRPKNGQDGKFDVEENNAIRIQLIEMVNHHRLIVG